MLEHQQQPEYEYKYNSITDTEMCNPFSINQSGALWGILFSTVSLLCWLVFFFSFNVMVLNSIVKRVLSARRTDMLSHASFSLCALFTATHL